MSRILVGLSGRKNSGKNTAGDYLQEKHGFTQISFAAPLKASAAALLDVSVDDLERWKNDPTVSLLISGTHWPIDEHRSMSIRWFLQRYGTEAHREIFGDNFWSDQLVASLPEEGRFVVTDTRFENECLAILKAGGYVAYIERPGTDDGDAHLSEQPPSEDLITARIANDSTIESLYRKLDVYVHVVESYDHVIGAVTETKVELP